MTETIAHLWTRVLNLGDHYGVNAALFGVLYLAHHPLFWGTMAWLASRVRRGLSTEGVIALGVFFWVMPYAYVLVFGHGLPWWAYAVAGVILLVGGAHAVKEIRQRLRASARP